MNKTKSQSHWHGYWNMIVWQKYRLLVLMLAPSSVDTHFIDMQSTEDIFLKKHEAG